VDERRELLEQAASRRTQDDHDPVTFNLEPRAGRVIANQINYGGSPERRIWMPLINSPSVAALAKPSGLQIRDYIALTTLNVRSTYWHGVEDAIRRTREAFYTNDGGAGASDRHRV